MSSGVRRAFVLQQSQTAAEGERGGYVLSLDHFVRSKALSMRTYDPEFSSIAFCLACSDEARAARYKNRERRREKENCEGTPHFHESSSNTPHIYIRIGAYSGGDGAASVWAFPLCLAGDNRNKRAAEKGRRAADEQGCRMVMRSTQPCVPVIPMTPCVDGTAAATAATATRCRRGHCLSGSRLDGGAALFCALCEEMR